MNEELKGALRSQGERVRNATRRYEESKLGLDTFDANSRIAVKADGVKRTESDTDAAVMALEARSALAGEAALAKAYLEGIKTDTQCLLAHVSLVCSETAAMSRISN